VRIAVWSPLPPQPSGIADYTYRLLEELRESVDLTAVVREGWGDVVTAPEGVPVVEAPLVTEAVDGHLYMMGNEPRFHGYLLGSLYRNPGVTVLHDPALVEFYAAICGGPHTPLFRTELRYNCPDLTPGAPLPTVEVDGTKEPDRLAMLLSRRVVTASRLTLVHSRWVRDLLRSRFGDVAVESLPLGAELPATAVTPGSGPTVVFGTFGGMNHYKRLPVVLEAFAEVVARHPGCRLVVAGRADDRDLVGQLRASIEELDLGASVDLRTDVELDELDRLITSCDVVLSLRWPTAGEMSATLMRALGSGRPVVLTDLPQFGDLDDAFAWRVPRGGERERLVELMAAVAADPSVAARAGAAARRWVEDEASFAVVARRYHRYLVDAVDGPPSGRGDVPGGR